MLLETIVKTSGGRPPAPPGTAPDDQPTTFLRVEPPPAPPKKPGEKPSGEEDIEKTVMFKPDRLKGKGKGGNP